MSSMFQYDPLEVLNRAQKSADEWWDKTLDNAKKRVDLDQTEFKNGFERDWMTQTYGPHLFKTNAENLLDGTKATNNLGLEPDRVARDRTVYGRDTLSANMTSQNLERGMSPENTRARFGLIDNQFQSPLATLEANAGTAGIADNAKRNEAALTMSKTYPGALSAHANFGTQARTAENNTLSSDLLALNPSDPKGLDGFNERLTQAGLGLKLVPGKTPGSVAVQHQDGSQTVDIPVNVAADLIRDRVGGTPSNMQGAFEAAQKLDQTQRLAQQKAEADRLDDERRALTVQYSAVAKESGASSPEARALAERLDALTRGQNQQPRPVPTASAAELILGVKAPTGQATQAPAVPSNTAGPTAAAQKSAPPYAPPPAPAATPAYQPPAYASKQATAELVDKLRGTMEGADAALNRVRSDWQMASSLSNRGAFTDAQREAIRAALTKAETEYAQRKADYWSARRAYDKDRGEAAYTPGNAMQAAQQANARRIAETYGR